MIFFVVHSPVFENYANHYGAFWMDLYRHEIALRLRSTFLWKIHQNCFIGLVSKFFYSISRIRFVIDK